MAEAADRRDGSRSSPSFLPRTFAAARAKRPDRLKGSTTAPLPPIEPTGPTPSNPNPVLAGDTVVIRVSDGDAGPCSSLFKRRCRAPLMPEGLPAHEVRPW
jgi:hypothetical protein